MTHIPRGYKMTEVGVIPEDWEVKTLGEVGESIIGLTYTPSDVATDGTLVLRSSNVSEGRLRFEDNVYVVCSIPHRLMVREDDILICVRNGSRELIGKVALIDSTAKGMSFGAFMSVFRTKYARYIFYQLQSSSVIEQIKANIGATINQITNGNLNSFLIPLPPTLEEQRAIADALSDIDAQLTALDAQIAKKRDLKRGAMQELLTGQRRLPGFSGAWEVKKLGEIVSLRQTRVRPDADSNKLQIELDNIESGTGKLIGLTKKNESVSDKTAFEVGDVLFGKLRAYLRKYWLADSTGICSTEIWVLTPNSKHAVSEFIVQIVQLDRFIDIANEAYGTHMPRSNWNVVKEFEVNLPPLIEQIAIGEILSDLEREISALEAQRAKTADLKQAMMQELLTGKTRLI